MTLAVHALGDLWPQLRPLWKGLDRLTRFALLDVLLHLLLRGEGGLLSVERLSALLGREEAVMHRAVNRLVALGLLQESGVALHQRFVVLNPQSDLLRWVLKLMELLSSAREAREQFMKVLADDQALFATY